MGAALARASLRRESQADFAATPAWHDLSEVERRALALCWQLIAHSSRETTLDIARNHVFLNDYIMAFDASLIAVQGPAQRPLPRSKLRLPTFCGVEDYRKTGQGGSPLPHHAIARILETCVIAETRFGVRRASLPDPAGYALPIARATPAWLQHYRDPEFWHLLLPILVARTFDAATAKPALESLTWILAQPDCDRATAAAAFLMMGTPKHIPAGDAPLMGYALEGARQSLAEAILTRAEAGFYAPARLTLSCLGLSDTGADRSAALFATPFDGRPPLTPFFHDTESIRIALL